ncbi:ladderlectin-like [Mastacembelus armatus]|uniref:ladderlectin-like n=1 Tax=Mastacembelus armatus TaxID=205130 RepID=UPI001436A36A|nr:ladderlectin-like [Mastacembelus armatus]
MKMRTVTLLCGLCGLMGLSEAAGGSHVVKRQTYCPSGWTGFNRRCFCYIPTAMTDANLASVHRAEEYHEIQKMIVTATHAYREAWLGGSDAQEEGIWLWSDGSPFNYRHCGGFNNYRGRQHCLQMNYGNDNCWDDQNCNVRLPFVCARTI